MTAAKIIEEIKHLPPEGQVEVIEFARSLEKNRKLSGEELSALAKQMAETNDPVEAQQLRETIVRGFYGGDPHA